MKIFIFENVKLDDKKTGSVIVISDNAYNARRLAFERNKVIISNKHKPAYTEELELGQEMVWIFNDNMEYQK